MHLKSTQEQLKEANEEDPDPEFEQAIKENEGVMYVPSSPCVLCVLISSGIFV